MIELRDLEWAAGFVLGEGCFRFSGSALHVVANQAELWPLHKLQRLFGGKVYVQRRDKISAITGRPLKDMSAWVLTGHHAAGFCMTMYPLLSPVRQEQIRAALNVWRTRAIAPRFRTQCPRGHAYETSSRLYLSKGRLHRYCVPCHRQERATRPCSTCGCVDTETTPGCMTCYQRHWKRRHADRARASTRRYRLRLRTASALVEAM